MRLRISEVTIEVEGTGPDAAKAVASLAGSILGQFTSQRIEQQARDAMPLTCHACEQGLGPGPTHARRCDSYEGDEPP